VVDVDAYTAAAQAIGLAQFDRGIVIFTDSNWTSETPLRVRLTEAQPNVSLGEHEHVVMGGIECPTGELRIFSPEETGANERTLTLPPGLYGVIACGDGFGQADEHGDDGADRYELWLWPTEELPDAKSLKEGLRAG